MSSSSSVPSTPATHDVSVGCATGSGPSGRLVISVVGEKFIPNGHSITKTITGTFRERQDASGYTWKNVGQAMRDFYWHEFMKVYQWNPTDDAITKLTWNKVASSMYTKKMCIWRHSIIRPNFIQEDIWNTWKTYWSSDKWIEKSRIATQNRCSETGGPGTGPSKHTGGSRSTVEHTIKLAIDLRRPANSWDIFKKVHVKSDGTFVDAKSKSVNDQMQAAMGAILNSADDAQEGQEADVNRIYYDLVGGLKKRRVYGLGSQALTMYPGCNSTTLHNLPVVPDHVAEERIKLLEEEMLRMRETQERNLQQHVEAEVQQRVEEEVQQRVQQEVERLRQESDEKFQSMDDRWTHLLNEIARKSGPTLPRRSPNA